MPPASDRFDVSVIGKAPDETPDAEKDLDPSEEAQLWDLISDLQTQLAATQAERDELRGRNDIGTQKALLVRPYANKVFEFLCWYCVGIFIVLMLAGTHHNGFEIHPAVLSVLVGSTAVAAIGLVHTVIKGLFGAG